MFYLLFWSFTVLLYADNYLTIIINTAELVRHINFSFELCLNPKLIL